ncbi:dephospho-CoA kinase [Companilactobacillus sp.]|jgi:dephospho-CoA kinase|uniref:dephospho-CoA kinase n=1 Tax=Companilactobacillus sp. TaxID=2767905 RepID=UPI0025C66B86|nr:dephospho-CoA kinase [Companilactobacillus sp.]MCH4007976.1 dephospho-CoA kinase [Companilactobacillus sp.]MCH4051845.1 dephospho-CoA kinase [Companilactobacillus sp.]MCH4075919.1 dephospho-CoA kinase [Companilactobacillus sp.]MCH4124494.1 dephospho-CoA kinase [Companilactobacillus sp.]MCH4132543.1 dephospho-CoA kinase [Companilactobacillus sp.]
MSKIYGLTGGIAAGKTTVLKIFKELGCRIFDADKVARQVVEPGTPGLKQVVKQFSKHILLPNGSLDRKKLGRIVFSDKRQLKILNNIMGPLLRSTIVQIIDDAKKDSSSTINIFEIQLLFEGSYQEYFDATIAVYVEPEIQLERLMKRNDLNKQAALDKINSQMPMTEKKQLADYVLDNSHDIASLKNEISQLLKQL